MSRGLRRGIPPPTLRLSSGEAAHSREVGRHQRGTREQPRRQSPDYRPRCIRCGEIIRDDEGMIDADVEGVLAVEHVVCPRGRGGSGPRVPVPSGDPMGASGAYPHHGATGTGAKVLGLKVLNPEDQFLAQVIEDEREEQVKSRPMREWMRSKKCVDSAARGMISSGQPHSAGWLAGRTIRATGGPVVFSGGRVMTRNLLWLV